MMSTAPTGDPVEGTDPAWSTRRQRMVDADITARGVTDSRVLDALREVPRELFVPAADRTEALNDAPLSIGHGQTISQPYMVAYMAELAMIEPDDRVLEVGTGSGYGAAVLSRLACEVWTIERIEELALSAALRLNDLGIRNVRCIHGDGIEGLEDEAPFDAIVVAAGAKNIPARLIDQLAEGGRLIMPVGSHAFEQTLTRVTIRDGVATREHLGQVRFVPLVRGTASAPGGAGSIEIE